MAINNVADLFVATLERAGVKPHRWRARTGVSAFDAC